MAVPSGACAGYFSDCISSIEVTATATLTPVCACTESGCSVKDRLKPPTSRLAPPPVTTLASALTPT
jgi:hypothetical protein